MQTHPYREWISWGEQVKCFVLFRFLFVLIWIALRFVHCWTRYISKRLANKITQSISTFESISRQKSISSKFLQLLVICWLALWWARICWNHTQTDRQSYTRIKIPHIFDWVLRDWERNNKSKNKNARRRPKERLKSKEIDQFRKCARCVLPKWKKRKGRGDRGKQAMHFK